MENERDEFTCFPDGDSAIKYYSEKLNKNFTFLNHQSETHFHEVDIKRWETRQCVTLGLGISAIAMVGIILEEFLKGLLKRHYLLPAMNSSEKPDLRDLEEIGLEAENAFGGLMLHNAIQKARKENLITEQEENHFMQVKEFIRNAFVHSDKSKTFDPDGKPSVNLVSIEDGALKVEETRNMNPLSLIIAHGMLQKDLADKNCQRIFQEVDEAMVAISRRFWSSQGKKGNT